MLVWFIYPETANVRLEDMNSIFGDATTVAPTPEQIAEADSFFSGNRSPMSFRLGDQDEPPVPDSIDDLEVPDVKIQDGKPMYEDGNGGGEGVAGWISNMAKGIKNQSNGNGSGSGKYKKVGQEDDE